MSVEELRSGYMNLLTKIHDEEFTRKYIRLSGKDKKPGTLTPVGNSFIKTDGFGIRYIISLQLLSQWANLSKKKAASSFNLARPGRVNMRRVATVFWSKSFSRS